MYDKHPVYPHHADLFWAYEPYKTIYVVQRIITTLLLVPCWVVYYGLAPRKYRPRPSWSIAQIVVVKFMKRMGRVVEVAGVTWGTRDPTTEPDKSKLKETRFEWAQPIPEDLRTGIVDDPQVECKPVGMFVWPKEPHPAVQARKSAEKPAKTPYPSAGLRGDPENFAASAPPRLIGLYLHGGGYCHYSAHESSGTSRVPRRLVQDGHFQEIYAVEYRLLQHAPVPGAIQDAAAVYTHLIINELGAEKGPDGRYYFPDPPRGTAGGTHRKPEDSSSIVNLPSNSAITRNDLSRVDTDVQDKSGHPGLSPLSAASDSSEKNDDPTRPMLSGNDAIPPIHISRPSNGPTDSTGSLRNQDSLMGSPGMTPVMSPYPASGIPKNRQRTKIVLIGDSAGGNLVLALARWIRDEGILPPPDGLLLLSPSSDPSHTLPQVPASRRPRPHERTDYLLDTPEPRALLQRTFLGHHPPEFVYSPYISPSSEWVLSVFHGAPGFDDLETIQEIQKGEDTRTYTEGPGDVAACDPDNDSNRLGVSRPNGPGRTASTNPWIHDRSGLGLFTNFPRALIVVGDAERLEREVVALQKGMERDGVRVRMVWGKDACHDVLILAHWDKRVREGIWEEIARWVREVDASP